MLKMVVGVVEYEILT